MTQKDVTNLNQKKIQQLLDAIGTVSQASHAEDMQVTEHDWRRPRYFTKAQIDKLAVFAESVRSGCATMLSRLYQREIELSGPSMEQCFFEPSEQSAYYIAFGTDPNKPFGILSIPSTQARIWIERTLGGNEQPDTSETALSELETSLLLDIAEDLLKCLISAYGQPLQNNKDIVASEPVVLDGSKEMLKMTFQFKQSSDEGDIGGFEVLICCDKLRSIAGDTETEANDAIDTASILRSYIDPIQVDIAVELGMTSLLFADVMDLQAGDIVILDKKITDPVQVQMNGKVCFHGRPAQSGGRQAVVLV